MREETSEAESFGMLDMCVSPLCLVSPVGFPPGKGCSFRVVPTILDGNDTMGTTHGFQDDYLDQTFILEI